MSTQKVVLLIEDQPLLRLNYLEEIESWGYTVLPACDGMQAFRLLTDLDEKKQQVDAIVSDMRMPTSGLVFCQMVNRGLETVPPTLIHSGDIGYRGDGINLKDISELKKSFKFVKETHLKQMGGPHNYIKSFLEGIA